MSREPGKPADNADVTLDSINGELAISDGGLVFSSGSPKIRAGQTAYDTGTGFWMGNDGGVAKFSIGNSGGNKLTWNGTTLSITGAITITNPTSFGVDYAGSSSPGGAADSIVGQGDLATQNTADWQTDVTGSGKPSNNADVTLTAVNGGLSVTGGGINLASGSPSIRSGQTAYNTGTGFWLGIDGGTPKFSIGNSSGDRVTWDGTNFAIVANQVTIGEQTTPGRGGACKTTGTCC